MRYKHLTALVMLSILSLATAADEHKRHARHGGITVVGNGEVAAAPDTVEFLVGALTQNRGASAALEENNRIITSVRQVLEGFRIEDRDLRTQSFYVAPQYKPARSNTEAPELIGYRVNHLLHVKLRQPERLGELLDGLIGAGSNVLNGIRFSVGEPAELKDRARGLAVGDAHRIARQLAEAGGVALGPVVKMTEGVSGGHLPVGHGAMEMRTLAAVPVAPGEQTFRVSVTVTYSIE